MAMINTEPDIKDTPEVIEKYGTEFEPKRENWEEIKGDISFKNVHFYYKEGEEVLEDFNLEVKEEKALPWLARRAQERVLL